MINPSVIYMFARTVHRIGVLLAVTGTVIVGGTGMLMRTGWYAGLDAGLVRGVHGTVSGLFFVVLGIMGTTGIVMYVYPWYMRRKRAPTAGNP